MKTDPVIYHQQKRLHAELLPQMYYFAQKLNQLEKEVKKCTPRAEFILNSYQ